MVRIRWRLLASIVCLVASALPVSAQEPTDRPVEIGVGVGGVTSLGGAGGDMRVSVTIPRGERRSIEGFAGIYRGNDAFDTRGVYGLQIRQPMARSRPSGFFSFGLMGIVARHEVPDCPHVNCATHMSSYVLPPLLLLAGAGFQHTVTPHLAVQLESQVGIALFIPVGIRVAAGVSIPLGHVASHTSAVVSR
jgi:hypothetical protein